MSALVLLLILSSAAQQRARAANPCDLFWKPEASAASVAGADVPGQLLGRPEAVRPTSLLSADRPRLRVEGWSQAPIVIKENRATVARWQTNVLAQEYLLPLDHLSAGATAGAPPTPGRPSRWALGFRRELSWDRVENSQGDLDYRVSLAQERHTLGVAYAPRAGWVLGAAGQWTDMDAAARGASVAKALELDPSAPEWPRFSAPGRRCTLGVARQGRRFECGAQYTVGASDPQLTLTRAAGRYTALFPGDARRVEAYAAVHRGPDTYFATGADFRSESEGTVLLGLAARGDLAFTTADSSLGAGWRRVRGARTTHVELDWRRNRLTTADQGYAGLLPGLLSDLYTVRADARASTLSLRGGCERELTRRLRLLSGLSVHRSVLDGNWRLRRVRGLGRDPETVSEHHLSNGVLAMVGLSLGLAYQDSHWRCVLTGTGAYGAINSALKNLFRHEPSPTPGGPSRRFRPQPIVALTAEYRF